MPKHESSQLEMILEIPAATLSFITLDALCIFAILIVLLLLIYKLVCKQNDAVPDHIIINWDFQEEPCEERLPKKFSIACIICICIYLLIYVCEITYFLMIYNSSYASYIKQNTNVDFIQVSEWLQQHKQFGHTVSFIDLLSWILFIFSKIFLFIIFIGRLYYSFLDTTYAPRKCVYILLLVCIPIIITLMLTNEIIAFQIDLDYTSTNNVFKAHSFTEMIILTSVLIICDGIVTFFVIYLFYRKLYCVLLAKTRTNRYISGTELELNENQLYFINEVVKHTLLCFMSMGLTQFVWYYSLITFISCPTMIWLITYYFVIIHGLITVLCVYLTYKFNDKLYYKLCNKPHKMLLYCCTKCSQRQYNKQSKKGMEEFDNVYMKL